MDDCCYKSSKLTVQTLETGVLAYVNSRVTCLFNQVVKQQPVKQIIPRRS